MTNDTKKAPELLPCPFCGGNNLAVEKHEDLDDGYVICRDCQAYGPDYAEAPWDADCKGEVAWNTRADLALAAQGALIERVEDAMQSVDQEQAGDGVMWGDMAQLSYAISSLSPDATAALEAVRREAVEQERARITREIVSALGTQIFEDETFSEIMKWEADDE